MARDEIGPKSGMVCHHFRSLLSHFNDRNCIEMSDEKRVTLAYIDEQRDHRLTQFEPIFFFSFYLLLNLVDVFCSLIRLFFHAKPNEVIHVRNFTYISFNLLIDE